MITAKNLTLPTWVFEERINKNAKVAVLLSTYNRPMLGSKVIEAILSQTTKDFTLYVLDNNSLDEVKDVLLKYQEDPRIVYYFSDIKNKERLDKYWLGVMLNIGFMKGKEEYIASYTDDCYPLPNGVEIKSKYLDETSEARFCYGGQKFEDKNGVEQSGIRNLIAKGTTIANGNCKVDLCQTMFRRNLMEEVGCFNEDIKNPVAVWADAELFERLAKINCPLYSVGEMTDVFIKHGKSMMNCLNSGNKDILLSGEIWE